jgi:hypothetical protein
MVSASRISPTRITSGVWRMMLEDPIEYQHVNRASVFEQIEVGRDTPDFAGTLPWRFGGKDPSEMFNPAPTEPTPDS